MKFAEEHGMPSDFTVVGFRFSMFETDMIRESHPTKPISLTVFATEQKLRGEINQETPYDVIAFSKDISMDEFLYIVKRFDVVIRNSVFKQDTPLRILEDRELS